VFFWDLSNDGRLDISAFSYNADIADIAADYLGLPVRCEPDAHYLGDGRGGFVNRTAELRLNRVTHPMGANFGDFDHDGYLDFYLGTGDIPFQMLMPNLAFRNDGGRFFSDITKPSGLGHLQKGHGIAFADLDQDGDQDLAVELGGLSPPTCSAMLCSRTPRRPRIATIGSDCILSVRLPIEQRSERIFICVSGKTGWNAPSIVGSTAGGASGRIRYGSRSASAGPRRCSAWRSNGPAAGLRNGLNICRRINSSVCAKGRRRSRFSPGARLRLVAAINGSENPSGCRWASYSVTIGASMLP